MLWLWCSMTLFTPFLILAKTKQNTLSRPRCGGIKLQRYWFLYRGSLSWFLTSHPASDLIIRILVHQGAHKLSISTCHFSNQKNASIGWKSWSQVEQHLWLFCLGEGKSWGITSPSTEAPALLGCAVIRVCVILPQSTQTELLRLEKASEETLLFPTQPG